MDGGTFTTIDVPGADSTSIFGINDSGQIMGRYSSDAAGVSWNGFVGTPPVVPEPGTLALLGTKLVGVVAALRQKLASGKRT